MSRIITLYDHNKINPDTRKVMRGLEPEGWYTLDVEYSYNFTAGLEMLLWQVVGTDHIFQVDALKVDAMHGENLKEHFIKALEKLAEHYHNWKELGYPEQWRAEYTKIFGERIKS